MTTSNKKLEMQKNFSPVEPFEEKKVGRFKVTKPNKSQINESPSVSNEVESAKHR